MQYLTVTIPKKAVTIGSRIGLADTFLSRLVGLLGKSSLADGAGLLIRPSSGVHTMWMRFAIDVVALDKDLRVLKTWQRLPPGASPPSASEPTVFSSWLPARSTTSTSSLATNSPSPDHRYFPRDPRSSGRGILLALRALPWLTASSLTAFS